MAECIHGIRISAPCEACSKIGGGIGRAVNYPEDINRRNVPAALRPVNTPATEVQLKIIRENVAPYFAVVKYMFEKASITFPVCDMRQDFLQAHDYLMHYFASLGRFGSCQVGRKEAKELDALMRDWYVQFLRNSQTNDQLIDKARGLVDQTPTDGKEPG